MHQEPRSGSGPAPRPQKRAIAPQDAFGTEIPALPGPGSDAMAPPGPAGKGPKPLGTKAGERQRAWRRAHPEKVKAARRAYYTAHAAEELARSKDWVKRNPERMKELLRKWRAGRTPEQRLAANEYARNWQGAWRLARRAEREKKGGA